MYMKESKNLTSNSRRLLLPAAFIPVSYTHLDVYKRQFKIPSLVFKNVTNCLFTCPPLLGINIKQIPFKNACVEIVMIIAGRCV